MASETGRQERNDLDGERASPAQIAGPLIDRLRQVLAAQSPVLVAIDGRSGSGKSTLSKAVVEALDVSGSVDPMVTVIEGDQFYAGGSAQTWDSRPVAERADRVIDWRRQHRLLSQLRSKGVASWRPFDWDADDWDSDDVPLRTEPIRSVIAPVVVLEGAYSARPELHGLLDLRVLLEVPAGVRRRQLLEREGEAYRSDWEARWSGAENHYFGSVMPPARFDLILGVDDSFVT
ncbi:uridine kinase family protein [Ilumatobacter sp.]|uniref:uridine kinase family protein n=1 Tax=Ilumatobacter sp. TaxID=1967498 RepID=UPI003B522281